MGHISTFTDSANTHCTRQINKNVKLICLDFFLLHHIDNVNRINMLLEF